jgi:hypothetical protein
MSNVYGTYGDRADMEVSFAEIDANKADGYNFASVIINPDDWGRDVLTTDRVFACIR